jgi:hypothetical protein
LLVSYIYPHLLLSNRGAQPKGFLKSRVTPKEWGILKIIILPRQRESLLILGTLLKVLLDIKHHKKKKKLIFSHDDIILDDIFSH